QELERLASNQSFLNYNWREDVSIALMQGWRGSSEIKTHFLKSLRLPEYDGSNREVGYHVLIEGYSGDEDVAELLIEKIRKKEYRWLSTFRFDFFDALARNFRDHPGLVAAIDEELPEMRPYYAELPKAILVGRTSKGKDLLLALLRAKGPH